MQQTALMVIDLQKGMFSPNPIFLAEDVLNRVQQLIEKARERSMPIVYIQHHAKPGKPLERGMEGWQIHPQIAPQAEDIVVEKGNPDAFHATILQQTLEHLGVTKLLICGIQTEVCVDTTTRRAYSLGYHCTLIKDAHSTWNNGLLTAQSIIEHHNQTLAWFARIIGAKEVLAEMENDYVKSIE